MRITVKLGTSTLAHATGCINLHRMELLCRVLADLKNAGHEILLVSSGAIGVGAARLQLAGRPHDMATKQAAAAVGQCRLMELYDRFLSQYQHTVAQVLLTAQDIRSPERLFHIQSTLQRLLSLGALPVINENDTVATDEICVGDNDTLSAFVAVSVQADLLVLLSDIDGLYTADPRQHPNAALLHEVRQITDDIAAMGGGAGTQGTGGMATKLEAARIAMQGGVSMVIANGARPGCLYEIVQGKPVGTRFVPQKEGTA